MLQPRKELRVSLLVDKGPSFFENFYGRFKIAHFFQCLRPLEKKISGEGASPVSLKCPLQELKGFSEEPLSPAEGRFEAKKAALLQESDLATGTGAPQFV
jgi:hypothetical protein